MIIEADSYKTSTAYALKTNKVLRDSTNINASSSVTEDNESGEDEEELDENEGEDDDQDGQDEDVQDEVEQESEQNEDVDQQSKDETDAEVQNEEDVRGKLMESLTNKLNGKSYKSITYIAQDKDNLAQLLLQEASDISRAKKVNSADIEFWKLAVSSTINLMHPFFEARLSKLFTTRQLNSMKNHMDEQKKAFQSRETFDYIDSLFDSLLLYQLDTNTNRVLDFIDEAKYQEKDKQSEKYKLLKLIWMLIINFERLRAPNATEALFSSNFEMLLTILFQGHNISIESGETVSDSTSRAAAANDKSTSDFGRKIDVLVHNSCYGIRNEYCCIEFKRQDAKAKLLTYQQSKAIRINGAILTDLIGKAKDNIYLIYMDFWGNDGYIAGMKFFENVHLVDQISSIHLPVNLIELEDFRSTVKYLYQWREHIIFLSQKLALGVFREKRKYETVDVSRPSTPVCRTPERSPAPEPLNMYYSPHRTKKTRGN